MQFHYIDPHAFDNSPLVTSIKAGVKALPSLLGKAFDAVGDLGAKAMESATTAFSLVTSVSWGATHSTQVAPAAEVSSSVPVMEQVPQQCKNYADISDLGCMAVPPLPLQVARGHGTGMSNFG